MDNISILNCDSYEMMWFFEKIPIIDRNNYLVIFDDISDGSHVLNIAFNFVLNAVDLSIYHLEQRILYCEYEGISKMRIDNDQIGDYLTFEVELKDLSVLSLVVRIKPYISIQTSRLRSHSE